MSFDRNSNFNADANFTGVKFGENKPVLETELNELQEIQNEARAEIVRDSIPSGFVQLGELDFDYMLNNENCVKLKSDSVAYVHGYKIQIPKDTIINIGKAPEKDAREDLLFLEVWKEEVNKDTILTKNGGEGQAQITNNIKDSRYPIETSRRVALKWRIRHVPNVDFNKVEFGGSYIEWGSDGKANNPNLIAKGGNVDNLTPVTSTLSETDKLKYFRLSNVTGSWGFTNDAGLWVSGKGNTESKTVLKTLDGFVYAIPMFRLYRKPSCGKAIPFEYQKINPKVDYSKFSALMKEERVERVVSENIKGKSLVNLVRGTGIYTNMSSSATFRDPVFNGSRNEISAYISTVTNTPNYAMLGLITVDLSYIINPTSTYTLFYNSSGDIHPNLVAYMNGDSTQVVFSKGVTSKVGLNKVVIKDFSPNFDKGITTRRLFFLFTPADIRVGVKLNLKDIMIVEGDWTNKQLPYFDGLKSLGEDESLITVKNAILNDSSYDPSTGNARVKVHSGTNYFISENKMIPNIEGKLINDTTSSSLTSFSTLTNMGGNEKIEVSKLKGRTLCNLIGTVKSANSSYWNSNSVCFFVNSPSGSQPALLFNLLRNLKPNTTYTLITTVASITSGRPYFSLMDATGTTLASTGNFYTDSIGIHKVLFTTSADVTAKTLRILPQSGTNNTFSIGTNILLLEGDCTSLPISQLCYDSGINSVGEENNKLTLSTMSKNIFRGYNEVFQFSNSGSVDISSYLQNLIGMTVPSDGMTFKADVISENLVEGGTGNSMHYGVDIEFVFSDGTSAWSNFTRPKYETEGSGTIQKRPVFVNKTYAGKTIVGFKSVPQVFLRNGNGKLTIKNLEIIMGDDNNATVNPYKLNTTQITLKEPLRSLPNGVCDEIVGNKVIRRVGKIQLTGKESWTVTGYGGHATENTFEFSKQIPISSSADNYVSSVCNTFNHVATTGLPGVNNYRVTRTPQTGFDYFLFTPPTSVVPYRDLSAWKTWLTQNPTTLYYELPTPLEEEIEPNYDKQSAKTYQLDQPLRSLPNGVKDEIVGNKLIRRCGEIIIDGNMSGIKSINTNITSDKKYLSIKNAPFNIKEGLALDNQIGDRLKVANPYGSDVTMSFWLLYNQAQEFRLSLNGTESSVSDYTTWLNNNPIKVIYELANPIEIPLKEVVPSETDFSLARQFSYFDNYLLELPNGVKDTVENNKVVRRVKKVVLNGSENWIDSTDGTTVQRFCTDDLGLKNNGDTVVNVFATIPTYTRTELYNSDLFGISSALSTGNYSKSVVVGIENSKLSANTIQAFKTWLADNPITIMFELATPTTEELSGNNNRYCPYHKEDNTYCGSMYLGNGTNDTITDTVIKSDSVVISTPFRESTGKLVVNDCKYRKTSEGYDTMKVVAKGKNLVDLSQVTRMNNTDVITPIKNGIKIKCSQSTIWSGATIPLGRLKPNTTYTFSGDISSISGNNKSMALKYGNNVYVSPIGTFTTPDKDISDYYIQISNTTSISEIAEGDYTNIQVEEGSTKTSYEPFIPTEKAFENTESNDIEDLRHQVSLTGFNYEELLNKSFDSLLRGEL